MKAAREDNLARLDCLLGALRLSFWGARLSFLGPSLDCHEGGSGGQSSAVRLSFWGPVRLSFWGARLSFWGPC